MIFTLVLVVLIFLLSSYLRRDKRKDYPPGPKGLPLVGYVTFLGLNVCKTFVRLGRKYGPIFSIKIGAQDWIIVNDYEWIREVLVRRARYFYARPDVPLFHEISDKKGIVFAHDPHVHKIHRGFAVKTMNEFLKISSESAIQEESVEMLKVIEKNTGKPFNCESLVMMTIANVGYRLVLGKRFAYDDKRMKKMMHCIHENGHNLLFGLLSVAFWTRFLPLVRSYYKSFVGNMQDAKDIMQRILEYDDGEKYKPNYVEDFLDEMKAGVRAPEDSFDIDQLVCCAHEIHGASVETTITAMRWCILGLAQYQDHQQTIYEELSSVIGGKVPSLRHRSMTSFANAFIHEIMRFRPVVSQTVRETSEEVSIAGFKIPGKISVLCNFWAVHFDPKIFPDPETFNPKRFLDANNCFVPSNKVIPFSMGPRFCPGKRLALNELYLFVVNLVLNYKIIPVPGKPPQRLESDGVFAIAHFPRAYDVIFQKRPVVNGA